MAQSTPVEGRTIGRYRVLRHVATGGMAEIYLAAYEDRGVTREAVVKVILRERARDRKFVQMFLDEARVSSSFIHPHIAQLFEVGRDGDTYFYAMEYVHGDNVRALIERSLRQRVYMPLAVTVAIGIRVAAALHYAHERPSASGQQLNAVHRDVTPANIMLGFDGAVKLLDFGIARSEGRVVMTQSGTVKGKFAYMSPEQCLGLQVDRRTDVFALGIVLYEVSTQRRAFRAESDFDTMERIIRGDLIPPRMIHATYPRELEAILIKALATDPAARYQTAAELAAALIGFQQAQALPTDEAAIAAIMSQLFAAEAPARLAAVETPLAARSQPAMSLASMLAATVEPQPVAAASWSRPTVPAPEASPRMMAAPAPVPVAARNPRSTPVTRGVLGAEPSTRPSTSMPAMIHAPVPAAEPPDARASALGTPQAMARVTVEDEAADEFARISESMVITIDESSQHEAAAARDFAHGSAPRIAVADSAPRARARPPMAADRNHRPSAEQTAVAAEVARVTGQMAAVAAHDDVPFESPIAPRTPGTMRMPAALAAMTPGTMRVPDALVGRGQPVAAQVLPPARLVNAPPPDADDDRSHLGAWIVVAAILAVGGVVAAALVLSSIEFF